MRIIGGRYSGRTIDSPPGRRTRPTTDRVREALGSVLSSRGLIEGAAVLDLFAGSGAIGLELLSRGAAKVVFVEKDRGAVRTIQKNLKSLDLKETVLSVDALRTGPIASHGPFDLVIADPPYDQAEAALRSVTALMEKVSPDGTLVFEYATRTPPTVPETLALLSTYEYGDSAFLVAELKPIP